MNVENEAPEGEEVEAEGTGGAETPAIGTGRAPLVILLVLAQAVLLLVFLPLAGSFGEAQPRQLLLRGPVVELGPVVLPVVVTATEGEELHHVRARMLAVELGGALSEGEQSELLRVIKRMGPHLRLAMEDVLRDLKPSDVFRPGIRKVLCDALMAELERGLGKGKVNMVFLESLTYD